MSRADKKRRHEAKRKAKRHQVKRQQSVSPLKRLADAPGETEYWMSETLGAVGQMSTFIYKRAAGLTGFACFLIDRGVVGLKDAYTRMNIGREEFEDILKQSEDHGIPLDRVTVEDVRRVVAGAVRWTHQNGMRLPKDWVKTASLIGGVGDWASADVSDFAMEFAGHPEDLRRRLIGQSFESYIRRPDVSFIFSDSAPVMDLKTGEYADSGEFEFYDDPDDEEDLESIEDESLDSELEALSERVRPIAVGLATETVDWLLAHNQTPSPELPEAWQSILLATLFSETALPDAPPASVAEFGGKLVGTFAQAVEEELREEYERAVEQVREYIQADPAVMKLAAEKFG
jgi:hypothetical protein